MVDSTAKVDADEVGKLLRCFKLLTVNKDWLMDTLCCVRSLLPYTVDTVRKEDLVRAGYTGPLVEEIEFF